MNVTQTLDVTNTITNYLDLIPQLFTTEDGNEVVTALWNVSLTDEGHTTVGIVLDVVADSLTVVETEDQHLGIYQKYTVAGIATTNGLSFDVIISNECVACSVGEDVSNRVSGGSEADETTNKTLLH